MSIDVWNRVWTSSQHSGTNLLMLLAIADHARDDGVAWPSVDFLANKCRMSKRNAQDRLRELAESGELIVKKNAGPPPKFPNLFEVNLKSLGVKPTAPVNPTAPVQSDVARGEAHCAPGVKPTAPKPSMNHKEPKINSKRASQRSDITFDGWIKSCEEQGVDPIPAEHPVLAWADKAGIGEWVDLAWDWFKNNYQGSDKRYKDWPQVFARSVRGNWGKQWRKGRDGNFELTVEGETTRRALEQS